MAFPSRPVACLTGSNGPVHAVAYSASGGAYILTGSADRTIRLYNPQPTPTPASYPTKTQSSLPQGRLIQTYEAHGYEVLSLAVAASNTAFVSGGGDRAVLLWDVATAVTTRRFGDAATGGHTARVNCVAFAGENDGVVVSGGFDTTVRLWDVRGGGGARPIMVLDDARDSVTCIAVRGTKIVAGSVDGRVRCYDVRMGRCTTDVVGGGITSAGLTRDGKALLVGCLDSRLRLMDCHDGACLRAYAHPSWRSEELRLQAVLGGMDRYVVVGDEMTGLNEKEKKEGTVSSLRPGDGRILAWDVLSGKLVATLAVPWGPDGYYDARKKVLGRDGSEKVPKNVLSCIAWREGGWGDQFCVGGTSGVVTVFAA